MGTGSTSGVTMGAASCLPALATSSGVTSGLSTAETFELAVGLTSSWPPSDAFMGAGAAVAEGCAGKVGAGGTFGLAGVLGTPGTEDDTFGLVGVLATVGVEAGTCGLASAVGTVGMAGDIFGLAGVLRALGNAGVSCSGAQVCGDGTDLAPKNQELNAGMLAAACSLGLAAGDGADAV